MAYLDDINGDPVIHTWICKIGEGRTCGGAPRAAPKVWRRKFRIETDAYQRATVSLGGGFGTERCPS